MEAYEVARLARMWNRWLIEEVHRLATIATDQIPDTFSLTETRFMKCPRDGTELQPVRAGGIALDKCHHCDGLWFDPNELDKLTASGIIHIEGAVEADYGNPPVQTGHVTGYMRCPRCGEAGRLHRFQYTYLKPVLVDRCESCLGIWLDRNELDAIIGEKQTLEEAEAQGHFQKFANALLGFWRKK